MIVSLWRPAPTAVKQRVAAGRGLTDRRKQQAPAHASVPARTAAIEVAALLFAVATCQSRVVGVNDWGRLGDWESDRNGKRGRGVSLGNCLQRIGKN